jgi:hypothetical protein
VVEKPGMQLLRPRQQKERVAEQGLAADTGLPA